MNDDQREYRLGLFYGLACYTAWGVCVIYFKAVKDVPPTEVLAHRMIWALVFLALVLKLQGRWAEIRAVFRDARTVKMLAMSTVLIATNWYTFIFAVTSGQVKQASLGYYINPLVTIAIGALVLREGMRRIQLICVSMAAVAVVYFTIATENPPRIALILAFSFAFYGLIRKTANVAALPGLLIETLFLTPLAIGYLIYRQSRGELVFAQQSLSMDGLLMAGGVITAIPLWWFSNAARRLPLSVIGILQYIAPSLQFIFAVYVYDEKDSVHDWVTFAIIWTALGMYTWDAWWHRRPATLG